MRDSLTTDVLYELLMQIVRTGTPRQKWLPHLLGTLGDDAEKERYTLLRVGHVLSWGSAMYALRHIQQDPNEATSIALTLYCLLRFEDDQTRMLEIASSLGERVKTQVDELRRMTE